MKKIMNIVILSLLLTSCSNNNENIIVDPGSFNEKNTYVVEGKVETSNGNKVLPFNTIMNLTTYSEEAYNTLTPIYDKEIKRLHILFDRYNEYNDENGNIINNLKVINDSYGKNQEIKIDKELFELLEMSIDLSKLTEGYFNPTMGNLIDGWNQYFTPYGDSKEPNLNFTIEDENKIISERINSIIPFEKLDEVIELNEKKMTIKFNKYENIAKPIISLGAIAKGYAIDYMRKEFSKHNTPLIISGSASSSYMQGKNPHPSRDNWTIQINSPYKNELFVNLPLLISELTPGKVLSTSGDYEQLFYYLNNGKTVRRHHILDPFKGYSNDYYRSITLYSDTRSDILDGLSTALFNIEDFELINRIIKNVEYKYDIEIYYLFQKEIEDKTLELYLNEKFENTIIEYKGQYSNNDGVVRVKL